MKRILDWLERLAYKYSDNNIPKYLKGKRCNDYLKGKELF